MEQAYPTREQAQKLVLNECSDDCELCDAVMWCGWSHESINCGKAFLGMHDALDAKQAEIDGMLVVQRIHREAGIKLIDACGELKAELNKAHDLIRRLASQLNGWEVEWVTSRGVQTDDIDPDAAALIAEAEAMTKEG